MSTLNFASLLSSQNLRAFLRVVREGESSQDDDVAYRMLVGGGTFDSFADHPRQRIYIQRLNLWSTAAGAYQALAGTWDDFVRACGPHDFGPYSQDCFAVWCVYRRGALDDVLRGNIAEAIERCKLEWASLPGDAYGQGGITMQRALAVWQRYGGTTYTTADRPPAPIIETDPDGDGLPGVTARPEDLVRLKGDTTMAPALMLLGTALQPLIQSLISAFTAPAQAKIATSLGKAGADSAVANQFAEQLMLAVKGLADQAMQAAGVAPPAGSPAATAAAAVPMDIPAAAEAIAVVKRDPALLAAAEQSATTFLDTAAPLLDKLAEYEAREWAATEASADAAARRHAEYQDADGWDMTRTLVYGSLGFVGVLATFVCAIAAAQVWKSSAGAPTTEVWAAITGLIGAAVGIFTTIVAFRFGSNRQSAAKDLTNAALAGELTRRQAR